MTAKELAANVVRFPKKHLGRWNGGRPKYLKVNEIGCEAWFYADRFGLQVVIGKLGLGIKTAIINVPWRSIDSYDRTKKNPRNRRRG